MPSIASNLMRTASFDVTDTTMADLSAPRRVVAAGSPRTGRSARHYRDLAGAFRNG